MPAFQEGLKRALSTTWQKAASVLTSRGNGEGENLLLEFSNEESIAHLFCHWTSSAQSGVKLGVDTMVEKAS